MYDGIKINYLIRDYPKWIDAIKKSFITGIDIITGEISTINREFTTTIYRKSKWETYDLTITEVFYIVTGKTAYYLTIEGSLHKNYYEGKNYLPFTHQQVIEQINYLCKNLCIEPQRAKIWSLEIGVNIVTPFEVTPFLTQNIICYKTQQFNRYTEDKKGFCLGNYCKRTQYIVKIYDKGLQHGLPQNLIRIEKRFIKMQPLKKVGIKYLSDLFNKEKTIQLLPMLLSMWDTVLIYDVEPCELNIKGRFKKEEINLLIKGQDHKYWVQLIKGNRDNHNYQRKKFISLVKKYGNNWQYKVKKLIKNEWENLCNNYTNLPIGKTEITTPNHLKLSTSKNDNLHILTIKVKGKNVENRFCQSCGKEITSQKEDSKFCSAKYVGYEAAHQCRNNINNQKYKIEKIQRRGVLFDITPFFIPR